MTGANRIVKDQRDASPVYISTVSADTSQSFCRVCVIAARMKCQKLLPIVVWQSTIVLAAV